MSMTAKTLGERYRIVRPLARGGMGLVFEVQHQTTGRIHAGKVIIAPQLDPQILLERFHREARSATRIGSPHVVDITDAGLAPEFGGAPFLIMERLQGWDVARLLAKRGFLTPSQVVALLNQVVSALEAAHRISLLHRDLKPANLFVHREPDGSAWTKILDFGLATSVFDLLGDHKVTGTLDVMGTPAYMAPEQARGDHASIGPHTDLWAIGMIAFELLTGQSFFADKTSGVIIADLVSGRPVEQPSQLAPGVGGAFDSWFLRSCHPDPGARFASATNQLQELAAALACPILPPSDPLPPELIHDAPRSPALAPTDAAVVQHVLFGDRASADTLPTPTLPTPALEQNAVHHTVAPPAGKPMAMWAMAIVTASAVAAMIAMALSMRSGETVSATVPTNKTTKITKRPHNKTVRSSSTSGPASSVNYVEAPALAVRALKNEFGANSELQQVTITTERVLAEARIENDPSFRRYTLLPSGDEWGAFLKTSAKPDTHLFDAEAIDAAVLARVIRDAKRRFAPRELEPESTTVLISRFDKPHPRFGFRIYAKQTNQESVMANYDRDGRCLSVYLDGVLQRLAP